VEDRASLRKMLERALGGEGYAVESSASAEEGIERLQAGDPDLVLTDLKLPGASGLEVVAACQQRQPPVPVVVMTAYGTVGAAVEAMKRGALDFLEKPVEIEDLFRLVASLLRPADGGGEAAAAADPGAEIPAFQVAGAPPIIGCHPRLRASLHLLTRVAPTESTVLLTGESGTGKELFARALHGLSNRREGPFVAVNCAAIPEALIENELFGHERGAFTGADRRQAGRFEAAGGGTLLLDEIGELGSAVQAKVLRVLEERSFERVGGSETLNADVRLVAATNQNLAAQVAAGRFRSDLFFRLDVFPIELPPLRDRADDLPALSRHLLARLAKRHDRPVPEPTPEALALLARQLWPGNVRQLANVLERAVILAEGPRLSAEMLQPWLEPLAASADRTEGEKVGGGPGERRERLRRALIDCQGDKQRAAEQLGWSYRTLQRRVQEYDLEGVPQYRSGELP
jgi:DNA-binding NtrC family response regulator